MTESELDDFLSLLTDDELQDFDALAYHYTCRQSYQHLCQQLEQPTQPPTPIVQPPEWELILRDSLPLLERIMHQDGPKHLDALLWILQKPYPDVPPLSWAALRARVEHRFTATIFCGFRQHFVEG